MLTSVKLEGNVSPAVCTFCVSPSSLFMMVTVSPTAQSFVFKPASKFLFIYIHLCSFTEFLIPWELNRLSLGRRPDMLIEALLLPYNGVTVVWKSYVYWTVHHRDSWRIKHQLNVTSILFHFLCAQHVADINMSINRSLRLFCWITTLVVLFLVRCVLEFRCGWVGVVSMLQAEAASACNIDTTPTQPHRNFIALHFGFYLSMYVQNHW